MKERRYRNEENCNSEICKQERKETRRKGEVKGKETSVIMIDGRIGVLRIETVKKAPFKCLNFSV